MASLYPHDYFSAFADFSANDGAPVLDEFHRLAKARGWSKGSDRFRAEKNNCLRAQYILHVQRYVDGTGRGGSRLARFQSLCEEVGINSGPLTSITACTKALKNVHVNVVDLIDSRRKGKKVKVWPSYAALQDYTFHHKKFFPKHIAKEDGPLRCLLREIF